MLVTVAVATYNSALFVEETLNSIKSQNYQNIELIVSDDCSVDNTIEVAKKWIDANKLRFKNTELITVSSNTGVSANCNRMIRSANAQWIKFISGDDILLPECISDNMKFIQTYPDVKIVFSQVCMFQNDFKKENYLHTTPKEYPHNLMHPDLSVREQYKILLESDRIHFTPSYFFHKEAILSVGGYDETDRLIEDYPMWLKLTKAGIRLNYFHKETVGYRIHEKALNNVGNKVLFKPSALKGHLVRKKYVHSELSRIAVGSENHTYRVNRLFQKLGWNQKTKFKSGLHRLLTVYMNPYLYLQRLNRMLKMIFFTL